jgi:tetratricopeptide (TPR) repeat protein
MTPTPETRSKLERLLGYLAQDPTNLNLLQDAATAALEQGELAQTGELLARYEALAPLPPALLNIAGLAALGQGDLATADQILSRVLEQTPDDAGVRCNLAWTRARQKDWPAVAALLDDDTVAAEPRAAVLKIQAAQHLGQPEDALAWADRQAQRGPLEPGALATLSVAALDAEDLTRAKTYAEAAGDRPEAVSTLGFLELNDGRPQQAEPLFDHALAASPSEARALLGKGLARLSSGDPAAAAGWLDQAAGAFETHLGSWIAAGWAYFVAGDLDRSRERFATALALDDTFAESHGALAVLDLVAGRKDAAERGVEVALRLDRRSFSGLLGKMLLLEAAGDTAGAERLRTLALTLPIGADGLTIAAALSRLKP